MLKRFLLQTVCALTLSYPSLAQSEPQTEEIVKESDEIGTAAIKAGTPLRRMHNYLRNSSRLHFETSFRVSSPTSALRLQGKALFFIQQPDSFRVEVSTNKRTTVYVSDGDTLSIYRPNEKKFVRLPADKSILGTMYLATGLLKIQARMIDFFWTVDYITIGYSEGRITPGASEKVGGKKCDRFTVKHFEDIFDVWLEESNIPLPCRLVSKRTDGTSLTSQANEFTWMDSQSFGAETFQFSPPEGAKEVELSDLD
jgi:hypothetical protein